MSRTQIATRVIQALEDLKRIENQLYALHRTDMSIYPENYEVLSLDVALKSEAFACSLRNLVISTTNIKNSRYLADAAVQHSISIKYSDNTISITLPALLPKKKQVQNKFLLAPLYQALTEYKTVCPDISFSQCVICIASIYADDTKKFLDYDNVETKQVVDAITAYFLVDDSSRFIDIYFTAAYGETDQTEIYLMDKKDFPGWINKHFNMVKNMS